MTIHQRSDWGARAPRSAPSRINAVGSAKHWEGPHMGSFPHSQCAAKVRQIQNFHMDTRKWADGAYSAIVCPHGDVYMMRGRGVRTAANGTNAGNANWHAICYLGGEGDPFTEAGKRGFIEAHNALGGGRWSNHSDHFNTACPGPTIRAWNPATQPPAPPTPPPEEDEDMAFIYFHAGAAWVTDGIRRRHIRSGQALKALEAGGVKVKHLGDNTDDLHNELIDAAPAAGRSDGDE